MSTVAENIAQWLSNNGHTTVFALPGLMIDPLVSALLQHPKINTVPLLNESSCGYAADGFARASQRLGVCLSIGSTGLSNLSSAIQTARGDHSPILCLVGATEQSNDSSFCFQNTSMNGSNDEALIKAITKHQFKITDTNAVDNVLETAAAAALQYPQGPVVIQIPCDIQQQLVLNEAPSQPIVAPENNRPTSDELTNITAILNQGQRTLAIIGRGICQQTAIRFFERYAIPCVTTLNSKSLFPPDHPLHFGNAGYGGQNKANQLLKDPSIDTLLLIGVQLGQRDSIGWDPLVSTGRHILALSSSIAAKLPSRSITRNDCSPSEVLKLLLETTESLKTLETTAALRRNWIKRLPAASEETEVTLTSHVLLAVQSALPDAIVLPDAGIIRRLAGALLQTKMDGFYTSATDGTMGWSLSAAIGTALARPDEPVVVTIGDGSMLMQGNELVSAIKLNLPILIIVLNNQGYGTLKERFTSPTERDFIKFPDIDWCQYASSVGVEAQAARTASEIQSALTLWHQEWKTTNSPRVLEVIC